MRYAIINKGAIENIAVADDPAFATAQGWVPVTDEADIGMLYQDGQFIPAPPVMPTAEEQEALRKAAYIAESDPLFFKYQRGDATKEEWLAKIEEIKARYPDPDVNS
jgi:hypothetical protein